MARKIHFIFGIVACAFWLVAYIKIEEYFPGIIDAVRYGRRGSIGASLVLVLPIFSVACFLFPSFIKEKLSPRSGSTGQYVLGNGFWYVVGYFSFAIALLVSYVLQSSVS